MKQIFLSIACAAGALSVSATDPVSDIAVERSESNLIVNMTVDPAAVKPAANREEWFRPLLTNGNDTLWLKPVVVAGRTRYYQRLRRDGGSDRYYMLRSGKDWPTPIPKCFLMPHGWRCQTLVMKREVDGCCGSTLSRRPCKR